MDNVYLVNRYYINNTKNDVKKKGKKKQGAYVNKWRLLPTPTLLQLSTGTKLK